MVKLNMVKPQLYSVSSREDSCSSQETRPPICLSRFRYVPVPLHQFLSPPFASMLTPMSWPSGLGVMFLLGSRAAQDNLDYRNHEEAMRCVSTTRAGASSSYRRPASGELPCRQIVYRIITLFTYTLSSIQGIQPYIHPTTLKSYFNQIITSTVIDMIAQLTAGGCKLFMQLASTGATLS